MPFTHLHLVDMISQVVLGESLITGLRVQKSPWFKYEYSVPTLKLRPFAYVIIVTEDSFHKNINAVALPFQQNVWILIFMSMLAMPLVLMMTTAKRGNRGWSSSSWRLGTYLEWAFLTLASLVDQCNDEVRRYFRTSQCAAGLWILWNFFSLIIMNCYDGQLYSFLATDNYPQAPDSLKELAYANFRVVTINTILRYQNGTPVIGSNLKMFLKPENKEISEEDRKKYGFKVLKLPKYYERLANKIHFIPMYGSTKITLKNITLKIIKYANEPNNENGFAFADDQFYVKLLDPILDMVENLRVIKRQKVKNFNTCQGWLLRKNFVFNRIQQVLWQMIEGGFHDFWDEKALLKAQVTLMKGTQGSLVGESEGTFNKVGYLLQSAKGGMGRAGQPGNWDEEPKPMSVELIKGVLWAGLVFFAIAAICVVGENLHCLFVGFRVSGEWSRDEKCRQIIKFTDK